MSLQSKLFQARVKGGYVARQAPVLAGFFASCAAEYLKRGGKLEAPALETITDSLLEKPLTSDERKYFRDVVGEHKLSKWALPFSFFRLPNKIEKKVLGEYAIEFHDRARKHLVREVLPEAHK